MNFSKDVAVCTSRWFSAAALLALFVGAGCRDKTSEPEAEDVIRSYADLSGLESTHHEGLRDEFSRLKAEQSTIEDLIQKVRPRNESRDLNAMLEEAMPDLKTGRMMRERLEAFAPADLPHLDSVQLEQLTVITRGFERQRAALYQAVASNQSSCWVDYTLGMSADLSFVDRLETGYRLEAAQAAIHLGQNQPDKAIDSLERMYQYARKLSEVWHIVPRLKAADLRRDSCHLLSAIVNHAYTDRAIILRTRNLVISQLSNWSSESQCWVGDRAVGMHTFEMIRDGQYLNLLTEEEANRLKENRVEYATAKRVAANVDEDELYYLSTMRRVIESCSSPYYERGAAIAESERELNELRDSKHYPTVSIEMMLVEHVEVQRRLAADLARMEAWAIALSAATDSRLPSATVNPQTGGAYEVVIDDRSFTVTGLDLRNDELMPSLPYYPDDEVISDEG